MIWYKKLPIHFILLKDFDSKIHSYPFFFSKDIDFLI